MGQGLWSRKNCKPHLNVPSLLVPDFDHEIPREYTVNPETSRLLNRQGILLIV